MRRWRERPALEQVDFDWYEKMMIPAVQQRGAAIIKGAGGRPVRASAASAALAHVRDWAFGRRRRMMR